MSTAGSREINVTPLIDVLLVLLIIFIVMMPIMLREETIDLPPRIADALPTDPPLELSLAADLSVSIEHGPPFPAGELAFHLRKQLRTNQNVFVDFVASVPWREVVGVIDTVHGVTNDVGGSPRVAVRIHSDED